jgi:cyclopropane fatty-acyl-phospholipid synthase-like methyltransferase
MHSLSFPAAMVLAQRADFQGVRRFLDVGGGSGSYCIALALRYLDMRFTVLDLPEVCPTTREFIRECGLEDRIQATPGDMYAEAWPSGYNVHFLSNVFHNDDLGGCLQLARNSHQALAPGGRLCVHEVLQNDTKDGPPAATDFSLAMRYFNGRGGQYTAGEIAGVLGEAGFTGIRVMPTGGYYSLVSGVRA